MSREEFCYGVLKEVAYKCEEKGGFLASKQVVSAIEVLSSHLYDVVVAQSGRQGEDSYKTMWDFLYKYLDSSDKYFINTQFLLRLMERIEQETL